MSESEGKRVFTVAELCEKAQGELCGPGDVRITGVNSLECAAKSELCFAISLEHIERLADTQAGAVIVPGRFEEAKIPQIIVEDVNSALITILNLFAPRLTVVPGIHRQAIVEDSAVVGAGASIAAGAYIGHGASIGGGTEIGVGCVIGENSTVGENCRLDANVVVYHGCRIGNNCIILANVTIGSTGFGYVFTEGQHRLIPHNGGVVIEDCVDIGANTCIDRAKFGNTIIGAGTKIDNLVQIAHNVVIGKCCVIAGQAGISGSCRMGDGVVLAGQVGIKDHTEIGSGAKIGAKSGILADVPAGSTMLGLPGDNARDTLRVWATSRKLPDMVGQLKKINSRLDKLEAGGSDK